MGLTRGRLWERDGKDPQCRVSGVLRSARWVGKTLLLGFNTYLEERDSLSEAKIFAAQLPLARSLGNSISTRKPAPWMSWPGVREEKRRLETQLGWEAGDLKHQRSVAGKRNAVWPLASAFTSLSLKCLI